MKVTVAIDSFKGSLASSEACKTVSDSLREFFDIASFAVGDGGEGTAEVIARCEGAVPVDIRVKGIYSQEVKGRYYIKGDKAILECAAFVGLDKSKVKTDALMFFDTQGFGQAVLHAVDCGARDIVLCLGGSGTNDGGAGFLYALGARFFDSDGRGISPVPYSLRTLARADFSGLDPRLSQCRFTVLCDVDNPLCGEYGCSRIFAPQKGASQECVRCMDVILQNYAEVVEAATKKKFASSAGSGAAGGLGFALGCVLGADCVEGIKYVLHKSGVEAALILSDAVVSGEGKIDSQTLRGKVVKGIADLCVQYSKPLYLVAGVASVKESDVSPCVKKIVTLCRDGLSAEYCIDHASALLSERADELRRIILKDLVHANP